MREVVIFSGSVEGGERKEVWMSGGIHTGMASAKMRSSPVISIIQS